MWMILNLRKLLVIICSRAWSHSNKSKIKTMYQLLWIWSWRDLTKNKILRVLSKCEGQRHFNNMTLRLMKFIRQLIHLVMVSCHKKKSWLTFMEKISMKLLLLKYKNFNWLWKFLTLTKMALYQNKNSRILLRITTILLWKSDNIS